MTFQQTKCIGTDGKPEFGASYWKLIDSDFEEDFTLHSSSGSQAYHLNPGIEAYEKRGLPIVPNMVRCLLEEWKMRPMRLLELHGGYCDKTMLDWIIDTSRLKEFEKEFRPALYQEMLPQFIQKQAKDLQDYMNVVLKD